MKKDVQYQDDKFIITLEVPRKMRGEYTYSDGNWEQDAVCVWIDDKLQQFTLSHTQYLDYKDSLQATQPIIYFDSKEEAEDFAEKYNLMVEYAY